MHKRAIVVGAGIAGPALGVFLRRLGCEVSMHESRSDVAAEGGFLGLSPNAMHVLRALGCEDEVRGAGFRLDGMVFRNASGRQVGAIDRSDDGRRYGAEGLVIKRADLNRVLEQRACREGVELERGKQVVDVQQDGDGVTATFSDGTSSRADLLFGCDGLHSRVRRRALPSAPAPTYTGILDSGGFAPNPGLRPGSAMTMIFGRRAFFGYFVASEREAFWFSNVSEPDEPARGALKAAASEQLRARLLEQHAGDPKEALALLRAGAPIGLWPVYDMPPLVPWHVGRVCLLGDAAHATSPHVGQGAALALEDAQHLAKCLSVHDSHEAAFHAHQAHRKPRVDRLVKAARRMGSRKTASHAVGAWFRDLMLPVFLRAGARSMDWVHRYRVA